MQPRPGVRFECREYGDAAVLVNVLAAGYEERWTAAQGLGAALRAAHVPGLVDVLATYQDVFVAFDPLVTESGQLTAAVTRLAGGSFRSPRGTIIEIPVVYGAEFGPDLELVASELSLDARAVVELHTSKPWIVRFRASPVGAPFLDGPRFPGPVRRLRTPRARVVAGSIAISGHQSTIYPAPSPGGWRIIGRTPLELFTPGEVPPVAYQPGDSFRFASIEDSSWADFSHPLAADGAIEIPGFD